MKRALLIAVAAALLAAAAPADASWGPRQQLSTGSSDFSDDVALAGNARGDAIAAWEGRRGIQVAFARRGKRFGKPHYVPGADDGTVPYVAIDASGNALIMWTYFDNTQPEDIEERDSGCCNGVRLTVRSARSGHFRSRQTLTAPGLEVDLTAFAIRSGRIGIAWNESEDARVFARFGAAGHRLGREVRVSGADSPEAVSLLSRGTGEVTYSGSGRGRARLLEFRVRRGRVVSRRRVSPAFPADAGLSVASNVRGQEVAAWSTTNGSRVGRVYAGTREPSGSFRFRRVSRRAPADSQSVAIAPSGAGLVAWNTFYGEIFAANRLRGGVFHQARRFGPKLRGHAINDVEIAVDSLGRAVVGWTRTGPGHVVGAFRSARGRLLGRYDLGSGEELGSQATAALDAHGRARLIWRNAGAVRVVRARIP
jgi:hypothetical protein